MKLWGKIWGVVLFVMLAVSVLGLDRSWAGRGRTVIPLTEIESATLQHMREEEKLARDVYLAMYGKWGETIFSNIILSEQRHMDTIRKKLETYSIEDPALQIVGAFSTQELADLYIQLVAQGDESLVEALIVGCTIEDLDIADLDDAIDKTTHLDLQAVYRNLKNGSENHLRAYVAALARLGQQYTPQYIGQEEFDAIIER